MQELGKFNFKINVITNGLEKYISFTIINKLSFIENFQFLSSSLDSLVKNLNKDYLNIWVKNLIIRKRKNNLSKYNFYSSLTDRDLIGKEYEHGLNVWKKIEMKTMKDYHDLFLKCDGLLLADVFEKFRNNSLKNYGLCPSH